MNALCSKRLLPISIRCNGWEGVAGAENTETRWLHEVELVAATVLPLVICLLLLPCQPDEEVLVHRVEALCTSHAGGCGEGLSTFNGFTFPSAVQISILLSKGDLMVFSMTRSMTS